MSDGFWVDGFFDEYVIPPTTVMDINMRANVLSITSIWILILDLDSYNIILMAYLF